MNPNILATFEVLLEKLDREKKRLVDALRDASLQGHFEEAQRLLTITQRVDRIGQEIRTLRDQWMSLEQVSQPVAYEAAEYIREKREEIPTVVEVEAPELRVAERIFGVEAKPRRRRRMPVERTPPREFRLPILEALEQFGGRGQGRDVLSIVYEKMEHRLTEDDLKPLPSGGSIRWRNTAQWERLNMVHEGLLRDDSPRGVWEMSDAGRKYLEQMRQEERGDSS
jgi:hypothetical protein